MRMRFRSAASAEPLQRSASNRAFGTGRLLVLALAVLLPAQLAGQAAAENRQADLAPTAAPTPAAVAPSPQYVEDVSTEDLSKLFGGAGYDLASVRMELTKVPRFYVTELPDDLKRSKTAVRKEAFLGALLPLVLMANEEILADRQRLETLATTAAAGQPLLAADRDFLETLAAFYRTPSYDFEELLLRVDAVPVSLTLAQAIEESGWGTSRYAQKGNALFGQRTWHTSNAGLTARKEGVVQDHRAKAFADLMQSVRAYMHNLNTHPAYRKLRLERASMRAEGEVFDGAALADLLGRYAENEAYAANLRRLMKHNELTAFDGVRLDGSHGGETPEVPQPKPVADSGS